jgi:primosomal protein N''
MESVMTTDETPGSDAELAAIATCLGALRPLSEAARNRALAYLTERLAAETTASNGDAK